MTIMVMFTACAMGSQDEKTQKSVNSGKKAASAPKGEKHTTITMTSGNTMIEAELDDSQTSRQFIATLPITLSMKRWDDREYYAHIPKLSESENTIPNYENGDVTYYTGGPSLAVFFAKAGHSSQENLIRMGKVTSDLSLFEQLGNEPEVKIAVKNN